MGATIGQGWLWGRPEALPAVTPPALTSVRMLAPPTHPQIASAYEIVSRQRPVSRTTKRLLLPMSRHIENKGLDATEPAVLLACFQEARHFSAATRERFSTLSGRATFVAALGANMPVAPVPGVRGAVLADQDVLRGEWDVMVVGPHFAAALVARDLGDSGAEDDRRFDYAITHDRALVVEAATALLSRVTPLP
jgi:hypothetical protein